MQCYNCSSMLSTAESNLSTRLFRFESGERNRHIAVATQCWRMLLYRTRKNKSPASSSTTRWYRAIIQTPASSMSTALAAAADDDRLPFRISRSPVSVPLIMPRCRDMHQMIMSRADGMNRVIKQASMPEGNASYVHFFIHHADVQYLPDSTTADTYHRIYRHYDPCQGGPSLIHIAYSFIMAVWLGNAWSRSKHSVYLAVD